MALSPYYLHTSKSSDLADPRDRALYRMFEILPAALSWVTLFGIVLASWLAPAPASIFIIAFDAYWLIKTVFLSFHLRASYRKMRQHIGENWVARLQVLGREQYRASIGTWRDVYHLVILPFYNESDEVLRGFLDAVRANDYPMERVIVVVAAEERGEEAVARAQKLQVDYGNQFFKFLVTAHPADMPGEIPGKGSNESFAAAVALREVIDANAIPHERVLVSSLDSDTEVYPQYFACLTYHFVTAEKPYRSSYQPIPVYTNNIWSAPALSRVVASSGTFWQMMQQARPERLTTFSSHSMPLGPIAEMGWWQKNIVSEDSRIFWQLLSYYHGDWRVVPLYYPVSMDANVAPTFFGTAKNVYKQQRRWGWGVENVPYTLFAFLKDPLIPRAKKFFFTFNQLEGFWSWGTNSLLIFLLGWLPIILGGEEFGATVLSHNLPRVTRILMTLAMFGMVTSAIISTALLPPRPPGNPFRKYIWMVLQWLLIPVTIVFFGAIPGLEAQTRLMLGKHMGFWVTPKYRRNQEARTPR
ncbi:MAG: hypothetical protein A3I44_00960 [Candidatus Sungbacteria bacterium RIFCSPLOWO2_02_FULL_51_17]|uniref:Glycosyltransferase 2-like domain-containing protein n=1 Tax=Candidatus Sungbacteria bacterium RIFCSPHIGHO2_02_FULL_51_29 TaxID=1802273 RepID=A0A1G2KX58_9BACT|nr:MAG: hypothetical protein A2676_01195 [Candidatus Sungbacteria bacterium RIFCSPHIGHO2_01_FULL_51_22]OHA03998.1 MAG: hypothetical protein A3C16_03060 [Candidatus Sungbacteria bacterium RIFCSPHIGHO2_02_FULL_51_29]OHA07746.1 MAG: hypothetical protein A3B29_04905 [Candidatus Sungbacteria bacterium RIFCSPLOWO2_01_FULL_51_34]OHA11650.1 MAG: hypothetical protein A3I44_00960 [Candidatus Sungbacteria bacterium RIFCSPLOWO2_02_FULL_51_17]